MTRRSEGHEATQYLKGAFVCVEGEHCTAEHCTKAASRHITAQRHDNPPEHQPANKPARTSKTISGRSNSQLGGAIFGSDAGE